MPSVTTDSISADLKRKIEGLLAEQGLGVLATRDRDGHPYASLIAFGISPDRTELFFATPRATRKFANLTHDPRVALLVNNSANQPDDFHQAMAVTVLGRARELEPEQKAAALGHYLARHPYLEGFANAPSCAVLSVRISGFTMVQRFQNVSELKVGDDLDSHS